MLNFPDFQWNRDEIYVSQITHEQYSVYFYCRWDMFF